MKIITEYTIELQIYHDQIVGRLSFKHPNEPFEDISNLYSLSELQNIIALWRDGALCGSFAMGTRLAQNPVQYLKQKE